MFALDYDASQKTPGKVYGIIGKYHYELSNLLEMEY